MNEFEQELFIFIGKETREYLKVTILDRCHPECLDYWDGNWLNCKIDIKVGGFTGDYISHLRSEEFFSFYEQLKIVYEDLSGVARFENMEEWLDILVKGDGIGHFKVNCIALDEPGIGNTLEFKLEIDQTEIADLIKKLDKILKKFSVIGK